MSTLELEERAKVMHKADIEQIQIFKNLKSEGYQEHEVLAAMERVLIRKPHFPPIHIKAVAKYSLLLLWLVILGMLYLGWLVKQT